MSDADIMWEAYQEEIQEWNMARILNELKLLQQDLDRGELDISGYDRSKIILEDRIKDIIDSHDNTKSYDRAMKGI